MSNNPPALELRGISKSFVGIKALSGVNLRVLPGEIHALVGENGAGKSTLLKILSGVQQQDEGELLVAGQVVRFNNTQEAHAHGIAMIHQELQLIPELNVAQNMFLGAPKVKLGFLLAKEQMAQRAAEVLHELDPHIDVRTPVKYLSVAQRQMVEIARALLTDARVIAMDEPTSSLTPTEFEKLVILIRKLAARGVAIIYVSHKLEEVFELCSRATVLRDGLWIDELDLAHTTEAELVAKMVGRELVQNTREHQAHPEVVLEGLNLSWKQRVKNVSLTVHRGEILGIAGLVGAGRTELVGMLAGLTHPDTGEIRMRGKLQTFASPRSAIQAGIALVPEERKREGIVPMLSILSNVALPTLKRETRLGLIRQGALTKRVYDDAVRVNLRPLNLSRPIKNLSGGNQQKAIVCRWLNSGIEVLIFDEPTRGVDVGAKEEIYKLIESLAAEGCAIIVVSSELREVMYLSDRILVMQAGRLSGELLPNQFSEEAIMNLAIPHADVEAAATQEIS
ncbi:sugar ABC transporter ATP-binding protein [Rhodoferax sp. 4810]|nr:sugar ABC transporter ATP-binding protein [Rhodoferax jenense]